MPSVVPLPDGPAKIEIREIGTFDLLETLYYTEAEVAAAGWKTDGSPTTGLIIPNSVLVAAHGGVEPSAFYACIIQQRRTPDGSISLYETPYQNGIRPMIRRG